MHPCYIPQEARPHGAQSCSRCQFHAPSRSARHKTPSRPAYRESSHSARRYLPARETRIVDPARFQRAHILRFPARGESAQNSCASASAREARRCAHSLPQSLFTAKFKKPYVPILPRSSCLDSQTRSSRLYH
ncbi:hypothetical protein SDC9_159991 [bioreactor metagenome]|uniref:Uncharacterized protein n=1 Tax=bioreactor metagenome TaxID=1076179 RepID=A0A645FGQ1_9ZZZZ